MMGYSVFVSYSSEDLQIVNQIKKKIEALGVDTFVAEYSIEPGSPLNYSIIKAIKESDMFVLLWSKNANKSDYVKQEVGIAKGAEKLIIPFVLDESIELPEFIRDIKYIRAYENTDTSLKNLYEIISREAAGKQALESEEKIKRDVGSIILDEVTARPKVKVSPNNEPVEFNLTGEIARKACKVICPDFADIEKIEEVKFIENKIIVGGNVVKGRMSSINFAESETTQVDMYILDINKKSLWKQTLDYTYFRTVAEVINKLTLENILNTKETTEPLSITVNPNINYRGFNGYMGIIGCEILLSLDVNFGNNTEKKINAIINNIDFSPRKEIKFLKFDFRKGVYGIGASFLKQKIILDPGDALYHFLFRIKGIKSFNRDDFENCKYIPMVFKIEYSVSPRFQEKICEIEMKDFFEKTNNLLRKKAPAWTYKNF